MANKIDELSVTVIIPSRSYDFLLETCICETRKLYENVPIIIILDENSNLPKFDFNNVKVIMSDRKNISSKRNLGVKNCDTEYIAFLDSDAYLCKNWLENAIGFLKENPDYSVVTGNYFGPENESFMQTCIRLVQFSPLFINPSLVKLIEQDAKDSDEKIFAAANVIMRRNDYLKTGGMNENIYINEDTEFSDRLYENGYKIRFKSDVSIYHRICMLYPFLRKIFCWGYYKLNMYVQERKCPKLGNYFTKNVKKYFLPHILMLICIISVFFQKNSAVITVPLLFAAGVLIIQSFLSAQKLKQRKISGFFIILYVSVLFCAVFLISSLLGFLNIKIKSIQQLYKQY